ncbi:MAG: class I SAM-dependent RNA methyltransferase [Alphaproteobacteria bacterium]|nr:class I SAM-dependent RNA methyltransferase [Alphaproteobacteria bacterium]
MARSTTRELEIGRLGGSGDGIAETGDGRFYVPFTVPGDVVGVRVGPDVATGRRCELIELRRAGPDRVEPGCAHFHTCGGCAMQHLAQPAYRIWKLNQLEQALARRGIQTAIQPLLAAPAHERRRVDLAMRRVGTRCLLGFHEAGSRRIVDLAECLVMRPELMALVAPLRETMAGLLAPGQGLDIKLNLCANGIDLLLEGALDLSLAASERLTEFAARHDVARISWRGADGAEQTLISRRAPVMQFGGVEVAVPPGAFLQASAVVERALVERICATLSSASHVADLFAGCGTFAFPLSAQSSVLAVEGEAAALGALARAAQKARRRIEAVRRDLARRPLDVDELAAFDAVVFDPPRAGAREQAMELARSRVPLIVGVSCAPGTFARDARILIDGGYRLESVAPLDQFLWTPHLELAGVFHRA